MDNKETYYFSHDYGARNDPKLVKVLMKHGQAGKGVYWDLIEMQYEQGGHLLLSECESYAFALHTTKEIVESLVNDFGLFKNDGDKFWSESAHRRIEQRAERSEAARKKAQKRWEIHRQSKQESEGNADEMLQHSNGNAIKGKERKGKKKENPPIVPQGDGDSLPDKKQAAVPEWKNAFEQFWRAYDKKEDRTKCEKAFAKLNADDIQAILAHVPAYVAVKPERKYRKNPLTYLNSRCWEDEQLPDGSPNPLKIQQGANREGRWARAIEAYMVPDGPYMKYENELIPDRPIRQREYDDLMAGRISYSQFDKEVQQW